jgi:phospholipid/cholesterol/gamma-HCH transport system substrate-binding protein
MLNKQTRQYLKVGLFFLATLALIAFTLIFLQGKLNTDKHFNVVFDNARGIKQGEVLQIAGVNIGQVDGVKLTPDNRAQVRVAVRKDVKIPEGSTFRVTAGILGNNRMMMVEPSTKGGRELRDEETVPGDSGSQFDETVEEGRKLLIEGQKLAASINQVIGDQGTQRSLQTTLANTAKITRNIERITADLPRLQRQFDAITVELQATLASGRRAAATGERIATNAEKISVQANGLAGDARKLTQNINATLVENRANLKSLVQSADEAVVAVAGLTTDVRENINDPKLRQSIITATENLASISTRLDTVLGDVQRVSGDPRLSADIKETVANLKATSESVKNLTNRIEGLRLPGEKRRTGDGSADTAPKPPVYYSATSLVEPGFTVDSIYDTKLERLRVDGNYALLSRQGRFYRAGLYDTTYGNRLNLQIGQRVGTSGNFAYRYGLFAGRFGAGFDTRSGPLDFRFDFYDPNRFTINARAKASINRDLSITGGVDALGRENRATLGLQIRR